MYKILLGSQDNLLLHIERRQRAHQDTARTSPRVKKTAFIILSIVPVHTCGVSATAVYNMNILRSPTGSGIDANRSGSQPNLTSTKLYSADLTELQATFRNKRKQPERGYELENELAEMNSKMDKMMNFLSEFTATQQLAVEKISQDVSSIKEQVVNINTTTDNLLLEQDAMKVQLEDLKKSTEATNKKIVSVESDVQRLKANTSNVAHSLQDPKMTYDDMMTEFRERNIREKNIVLTGIPEPQLTSPEKRRASDKNEVMKIIQTISKDSRDPIYITRLGKYSTNKNRPIKACFASQEEAKFILRNKSTVTSETVKIFSDQTPSQQMYLKNLRSELQQRIENGEDNLIIKYVKGVPKIIKLQAKKSNQ